MIQVSIQVTGFYPYHIIEAIFSRLFLRLSQKNYSHSYLKCALRTNLILDHFM